MRHATSAPPVSAWTAGIAVGALAVYGVVLYNRLVGDRNRVLSAWSDVDVQLKRRSDLVPKLVDSVRQYAGYERATLEAVTELRSHVSGTQAVAQRATAEQALARGVHRLLGLVEAYPELGADSVFLDLQRTITEVENHIQFARRYYNGAVRALNTRIESFPDLILARAFAFRPAEYFELEPPSAAQSSGSRRA